MSATSRGNRSRVFDRAPAAPTAPRALCEPEGRCQFCGLAIRPGNIPGRWLTVDDGDGLCAGATAHVPDWGYLA